MNAMVQAADKPTVLVVDDTPDNLTLMNRLLERDYQVKVAINGTKALQIAAAGKPPDLILLDVMMPGMSGYDVCRELKANSATRDIPVIFVTAMAEVENEETGLALGAVDYLTKPIHAPILLARVRNHLELRRQALELTEWNRTLGLRVAEGIAEVERLDRLRRFFSPAMADLLIGDSDDYLKPRRKEIVVVFLDLRGYTSFTETYGADEVMRVLSEFHTAMGAVVMAYGGTLERFTGDGMMIVFNDPIEIAEPAATALRMAIDMQTQHRDLHSLWRPRGYSMAMGIGIAQGVATIGAIGFEGRRDYSAIGGVPNLAARLCGAAKGGQILVSDVVAKCGSGSADMRSVGLLALKGFANPLEVFEATQIGHA